MSINNFFVGALVGTAAGTLYHDKISHAFQGAKKAVLNQGKEAPSQQQGQQPLADISQGPQDSVEIKQKGSSTENSGSASTSQQSTSGPSLTNPIESAGDTVDALLNASNSTGTKGNAPSSGSI